LYDLNGVLVGHLKGRHVIDANTRSTPIGLENFWKANPRGSTRRAWPP
jgi:hypothetical protein